MKLIFLLASLLAASTCIAGWELTCDIETFEFQGTAEEFPGWTSRDLKFGLCPLENGTYHLNATYKKCGVSVQTMGSVLVIYANLLSKPITSIITRKIPVEKMVGCVVNKEKSQQQQQQPQRKTSKVSVKNLVGRIGGLVTKQGKPMEFTLKLSDADNSDAVVSEGLALKVPVGTEVNVEISGPHLEEFDVYATVSDCFVTPSADAEDKTNYALISNMCVEDPDTKIIRDGRRQILTFKSFSFTKHSSLSYLHCDVFACTSHKRCGSCVKDWRKISKAWFKRWNERVRIAMVFEPNTYQTLRRENLKCNANGITFKASKEHFPGWKASDIMIGTCTLNDDFSLTTKYNECGLRIKERRQQLLMQTYITGKPINKNRVIVQKRPIKYMLRCGYDRFAQISLPSAIDVEFQKPANYTNEVTLQPEMFLKLLDERGYQVSRKSLQVDISDTITAVIGGHAAELLQLKLYATNCFVTPTEDPDNTMRYELMTNSCPVDRSFKISPFGNGQKLSFKSFSFTNDQDAQLYLHCDVIACLADANCGVCWTERRKRSLRDPLVILKRIPRAPLLLSSPAISVLKR